LFSLLGSISLRLDAPQQLLTVARVLDHGSFTSSGLLVELTVSSRVDAAMRGSSISFLTRARSAWLDSFLG